MCIVDCASGKMCGRSRSIKVALLCKKRQFGRAHVLLSHCSPNLTSVILSIACTFWRRKEVPAEISPGTSLLKNGTSAAAACYVKALPRSGLNNVINLHAAASPTFTHSPIQARRNRWLYFFFRRQYVLKISSFGFLCSTCGLYLLFLYVCDRLRKEICTIALILCCSFGWAGQRCASIKMRLCSAARERWETIGRGQLVS